MATGGASGGNRSNRTCRDPIGERASQSSAVGVWATLSLLSLSARTGRLDELQELHIGPHLQTVGLVLITKQTSRILTIFFLQKFVRVFEAGVGSRVFFEGQLSCFKLIQIFEISSYKVWKTVLVD